MESKGDGGRAQVQIGSSGSSTKAENCRTMQHQRKPEGFALSTVVAPEVDQHGSVTSIGAKLTFQYSPI